MTRRGRVVVLTALPVEHAAVARRMEDATEEQHEHGTVYLRGRIDGWETVLAEIGAGNATAASEAERAIDHWDPDLLLFIGVAGGVKDVSLGDVVAATKVYGYESGVDGGTFVARPEVGLSAYRLVQRARAVAHGTEWTRKLSSQGSPRAFLGAIASGEKVVKTTQGIVSGFVRAYYNDALAVEMEGAGFMRAAYTSSVDALVIRGISDLLDGKENSDRAGWQVRAADAAAAFAATLLSSLQLGTSAGSRSHDDVAESDDIWLRIRELAPRLFPKGPVDRDIWELAGGEVARLDLSGSGHTQWGRAIRLLELGGGGAKISPLTLIERMSQEYSRNEDLRYLKDVLSRRR